MKNIKQIQWITILIAILSIASSLIGIFSNEEVLGLNEFTAITGETVTLYGKGLYAYDSVSVAAQGIASDVVTLLLGVPLLVLSFYFTKKGSFKARLMLTGTLGYFLYTYVSYTFLWMYNRMFLVYVILMSLSLFGFIMLMTSYDLSKISGHFSKKLPVKFIGGLQFFIALSIGLLWLAKIMPTITADQIPIGLEHYTTLVIQGMDLGILVPVAVISGMAIIKKEPLGFLLSSIVIIKGATMLISISAMIVNQLKNGAAVAVAELIIFPAMCLLMIASLGILLKNTHNTY